MAESRQQKPTILLLCLGDKWMTNMLDDPTAFGAGIDMLLEKAQLKRAKTLSGALKYLNSNRPDGILVADPGVIAEGNREILGRLTTFAQSGGTVVFSFCFASNINSENMDRLWQQSFDLPWKMNSYHRTTHKLNTSALGTTIDHGSDSNSAAGRPLGQCPRENCWYLPSEESRIESHVFPPTSVTNKLETPVAFGRVGNGYVGYNGDVNQETGTNLVLLRMFNLDIENTVEEV
ncbi:Mitochondrial import receptor subunit TOM34 [Apiospora arundinis]